MKLTLFKLGYGSGDTARICSFAQLVKELLGQAKMPMSSSMNFIYTRASDIFQNHKLATCPLYLDLSEDYPRTSDIFQNHKFVPCKL